jgi:hypothetical protein
MPRSKWLDCHIRQILGVQRSVFHPFEGFLNAEAFVLIQLWIEGSGGRIEVVPNNFFATGDPAPMDQSVRFWVPWWMARQRSLERKTGYL